MGKVLITGGAGFIGSHLTDLLLERGHEVVVFDRLDHQVHRDTATDADGWPLYLSGQCERVRGSVLDRDAVMRVVGRGVTHLVHLAATVGVGQSMTHPLAYVENNVQGSAMVLDVLARERHGVLRMAVASSMSVYGEGLYETDGAVVAPPLRSREQLETRRWELTHEGRALRPLPTPETKQLDPASVYAIGKRDQEEMFLVMGRALGIPSVALRLFNVYGSRQSLGNPYTGVAAIFISRLLNDEPPLVFEDGRQRRDLLSVADAVRAIEAALMSDRPEWETYNVGSGGQVSIAEVARTLARLLGKDIEPLILSRFRVGDVRHCYPDITKIKERLGFQPAVRFDDGMRDLIAWVAETAPTAVDRSGDSMTELADAKLLI